MNILVNLPASFFHHPDLISAFERLQKHDEIRMVSHDTADEIHIDLGWADALLMWSWPVLTE